MFLFQMLPASPYLPAVKKSIKSMATILTVKTLSKVFSPCSIVLCAFSTYNNHHSVCIESVYSECKTMTFRGWILQKLW